MEKPSTENKDDIDLHYLNDRTSLLEGGLVIKNINLIEDIIPIREARITAEVKSWQVSRILRRDFNLVASRLFIRCNTERARRNIRDLMAEIMVQGEFLKEEIRTLPHAVPDGPHEIYRLPLRLVSAETSYLFRALMNADEALLYINRLYKQHLIDRDRHNELPLEFITAYRDLKKFLWTQQSDKTAAELGMESGVA